MHPTKGHTMTTVQQLTAFVVFTAPALLMACAIELRTPVSQFDDLPPCTDGQYSYMGHPYSLTTYEDTGALYDACGTTTACIINSYAIHVPAGPTCKAALAHELNHLAGNDWVDRPDVPPMPFER